MPLAKFESGPGDTPRAGESGLLDEKPPRPERDFPKSVAGERHRGSFPRGKMRSCPSLAKKTRIAKASLEPEFFGVRKKQRSDLATAPLTKNFNFSLFKVENTFREFFFNFDFLSSFGIVFCPKKLSKKKFLFEKIKLCII